jgi:hypothetical protein
MSNAIVFFESSLQAIPFRIASLHALFPPLPTRKCDRTSTPLTSPTQLKFPFQVSPIIWSYTVIELDPTGNQHDPNYK